MKIRAFAAAVMAGVMMAATAATSMAACTGNMVVAAGPQQQQKLPAFRYTDGAPYMNTILDYMMTHGGQYYEAGDVMIPNFLIIREDASDPQDIKVWGNFWIQNYDLQGDNLFCRNGGENPGLLHLRKTASGYEVTGADMVGDGSSYTPDVNRIFGVDQALLGAFNSQDEYRALSRKNTIRNYVNQNNLPVSTYQDYGWDKVSLNE